MLFYHVKRPGDTGEVEVSLVVLVTESERLSGLDILPDTLRIKFHGRVLRGGCLGVPITDCRLDTVGDEKSHCLVPVFGIREMGVNLFKQLLVRFHFTCRFIIYSCFKLVSRFSRQPIRLDHNSTSPHPTQPHRTRKASVHGNHPDGGC